MSAIAQLMVPFEEDFPFETTCKDELQRALKLIERLQKESSELRRQLAESEHVAAQKELLLCSASAQERALRSELMQDRYPSPNW